MGATTNANAPGQGRVGGTSENCFQDEFCVTPSPGVKRPIEYPPPESVCGRVLGSQLEGKRLTGNDCQRNFGSNRLPHHEWVLRSLGWPIQMVRRTVQTSDGTRTASIGEYFLPQEAIAEAGEQGQRYAAECARINAERMAARNQSDREAA